MILMDTLDQMMEYYRPTPWVGLLRALEIEKLKAVRELCAPPILDLGCGDGFVAVLAFGHPLDAGIDINTNVLFEAHNRGRYRVTCQADARQVPFKSGVFRTIYSNGAIEHMDDLDAVLGEVVRLLSRGGLLVALLPSNRFLNPVGGLAQIVGDHIWNVYNRLQNHVNLLSEDQWFTRLSKRGFAVKLIETYGRSTVAHYLSNWDLLSKIYLTSKWPFFALGHGGNFGMSVIRMISKKQESRVRELYGREVTEKGQGYWILILAQKL
jgi:SAM-dependent methyltransferase